MSPHLLLISPISPLSIHEGTHFCYNICMELAGQQDKISTFICYFSFVFNLTILYLRIYLIIMVSVQNAKDRPAIV